MSNVLTNAWNEATPVGSTTQVAELDTVIQQLKESVREIINIDHNLAYVGSALNSETLGMHKNIRLIEDDSLATGATGICVLGAETCTNDNSAQPELVFVDESDVSTQITKDGALNLPTGMITMTACATAPTGWLLCQGQAISRTTYYDLFVAISTTYGVGNGTTTFNVPDLQDKFPIGKSSTIALGATGGSTTIGVTNLPAHTHSSSGAHTHTTGAGDSHLHTITIGVNLGGGSESSNYITTGDDFASTTTINTNGEATHTHSIASSGAHEHTSVGSGTAYFQPYVAVNYIIKI